jgi:hypothetical protein
MFTLVITLKKKVIFSLVLTTKNMIKLRKRHISWDDVIPIGNNTFDKEPLSSYKKRVVDMYPNLIPEILEFWLYEHSENENITPNYSWLDLSKLSCKIIELSLNEVLEIYIPTIGVSRFNGLCLLNNFNNVSFRAGDKERWLSYGTWTEPPIILDVSSLKNKFPVKMELDESSEYQLIEGYSRLGYFHAFHLNIDKECLFLKRKHKIYLISLK